MSQFSRPAVIIGVALGVAIPSVAVGYFLRDSAPAVLAPQSPGNTVPPVAINKQMPPPSSASSRSASGHPPADPIAAMTLQEAQALLERTQGLHQAAVRDRRDLLEKMDSIRARQQQQLEQDQQRK
ncbi:hypothetical protein BCR44DRAFT_74445 [Catenaria anguillulae PL171]|uniref:Uncharacterized protein n=1 Tax=Catenaria anguillulae PL171 TaxID=765915 RepID=A0A1Y2I3H8_9FUNG|nr:hypothetical protein BCR44DRAFT_74445 [Catenaria anguillulae PL171]